MLTKGNNTFKIETVVKHDNRKEENMTNKELLMQKIKASKLTREEIADKIGLTRQGLYRKILGQRQFKQNEISALMEILNIKNVEEINDIFFASDVVIEDNKQRKYDKEKSS